MSALRTFKDVSRTMYANSRNKTDYCSKIVLSRGILIPAPLLNKCWTSGSIRGVCFRLKVYLFGFMQVLTFWHASFDVMTCKFSLFDMQVFTFWHASFAVLTCKFSFQPASFCFPTCTFWLPDMQVLTFGHASFALLTCKSETIWVFDFGFSG